MGKRVRTVARGDLEIDEDRVFQEKMWQAERVAWVGFGALALVALGGLTGQGGPLSRTVARAETGAIEYPRVTRWETSDEIVLTLAGGRGPGEVGVVYLTKQDPGPDDSNRQAGAAELVDRVMEWADRFGIEGVSPGIAGELIVILGNVRESVGVEDVG